VVTARRKPPREAGYNLVVLIFLIGTLSVMAAAALPALKMQYQREKEAELVFRGLQYAEGIRVFQLRFGRYPNSLNELVELEPRSMRQLWDEPMMDDGAWGLVFASGAGQGGTGGEEGEEGESGQGRELGGGAAPTSLFEGDQPRQVTTGPIIGVVSRKKGAAARLFLGEDNYSDWRFTVNILPKPQLIPGTELVARANVESLGRGFALGLQPKGIPTDRAEDLNEAGGLTDLFDDDGDDN